MRSASTLRESRFGIKSHFKQDGSIPNWMTARNSRLSSDFISKSPQATGRCYATFESFFLRLNCPPLSLTLFHKRTARA